MVDFILKLIDSQTLFWAYKAFYSYNINENNKPNITYLTSFLDRNVKEKLQ